MSKQEKWYMIKSHISKERSIYRKILSESKNGDLIGLVSEVVVPVEYSYYLKNGKKIKREKVIYPGYVFLKTNDISTLKEYIKNIDGSFGLLTTRDGEIQSISEFEINKMLKKQEEIKENINSTEQFLINENVIITDGAFSNMKASIESINEKENKVKVCVMIFGRKNILDLSLSQISRA